MVTTTLKKLSNIYGIGAKKAILIHKKIGLNTRKQPTKFKSIQQSYLKKITILTLVETDL